MIRRTLGRITKDTTVGACRLLCVPSRIQTPPPSQATVEVAAAHFPSVHKFHSFTLVILQPRRRPHPQPHRTAPYPAHLTSRPPILQPTVSSYRGLTRCNTFYGTPRRTARHHPTRGTHRITIVTEPTDDRERAPRPRQPRIPRIRAVGR